MKKIFNLCKKSISNLQGHPLQCNALELKIDSAKTETVQGGQFEDIQYIEAEN